MITQIFLYLHSFSKMINPTSPPLKLRGGREGLLRCNRFMLVVIRDFWALSEISEEDRLP
jgi:hypothetical protein